MHRSSRTEGESCGWQHKVFARPMDTLSGSYSSLYLGNPLTYLFNSALCYVVSGVAILVFGVIITSVTFQNLDPLHEGNKERYAGPVLMGAGILIMGRGAFWKLKQLDCRATIGRHRALWHRLCNWHHQEDEDSEAAAIYLEPTDPEDMMYSDDPPSYAQVTSSDSVNGASGDSVPESTCRTNAGVDALTVYRTTVQPDVFGAVSNPALMMADEEALPPPIVASSVHSSSLAGPSSMPGSVFSSSGVSRPECSSSSTSSTLQTQASTDSYPGFPPPPYEQVRHIHQTRI